MQTFENTDESELEARFGAIRMRALRRKARRIRAGARSSTEILNALAARVERNPAAVLRDTTPAELH